VEANINQYIKPFFHNRSGSLQLSFLVVLIRGAVLCRLVCFSLSRSTMSMSSGSSLGSLASTGSQGSQGSVAASLSDIYLDPCQRLTYQVPEIDREALLERVKRVLKCADDVPLPPPGCSYPLFDDPAPRTTVDSMNSTSSDVASSDGSSGAGYLPTYEQHLERQKCRAVLPSSSQSDLSDSLQALGLGPLTSKLIASTSADCWHSVPVETTPLAANDVDYHRHSVFSDVTATTTPTCGRVRTQSGKSWNLKVNPGIR